MRDRIREELALVRATYGVASARPDESLVCLDDRDLIPGWNRRSTPILIEIPIGYPTVPPDNFLTRADLRLADGRIPSNTMGIKTVDGSEWLAFSHHAEAGSWKAHADLAQSHTLVDYVAGVLDRLRECS
jgi:Prokaryotic E2 family E